MSRGVQQIQKVAAMVGDHIKYRPSVEACDCTCHDPGVKMLHFMPCCRPAKNDEERAVVKKYEESRGGT